MFTFRYPWLLLALAAVPALAWLKYARRRRAAVAFPDGEALASLPKSWAAKAWWVPAALWSLGAALAVVALARPQAALSESRVETEGVDIVLLVDTSTSMREEDLSTARKRVDRLEAAKEVIAKFIEARKDDRIGLVAFAAMPYALAPLTTDHAWLALQAERLETGMLEDGTAIGDAIASAVNRLRDSEAKSKVVVLLTDGIQNRGDLSPAEAAGAAAALGIKIYTVGACSDKPRTVSGLFGVRMAVPGAEIDEKSLQEIAETTGGKYFRATDLDKLEETYRAIDEMEKTEIEWDSYTRHEERFAPFAWTALALLGLEAALGCTRLGRIPA
jgi:Ca-activated chloride channel family protein